MASPDRTVVAGEQASSDRFLDHLAEAIRFRTVAAAGTPASSAFEALRQWVATTYPLVWAGGRPEVVGSDSLVFTFPGTDSTLDPILLMGHLDVVPVEDERSWALPPFSGARDDTHLFGRGALDDKGSVVAILEAVEASLAEGRALRRPLCLAFGHDEESSGRHGAGAIARMFRNQGVRFALVLDEGGFVTEGVVPGASRPVALVGIAEKGYLDLEMVAEGPAGHSAAPPAWSPITRLARAIDNVHRAPMPARIPVQAAFFRAAARAAPLHRRPLVRLLARLPRLAARRLSADANGNALIRTTIAPTIISGGSQANVMPGRARAVLNVRILPGDTTADVLDHVRAAVGDLVSVRPVDGFEASPVSSHTGPGFRTISHVIRSLHPDVVVAPWVVIGATDARYFTGLADEVFRFTPFRVDRGEVAGFHGSDERIRIADAGPAVAFYRLLVERLCG